MTDVTRPRHLRAVVLIICAAAACAPVFLTGHAGAAGVASEATAAAAPDLDRPGVAVVSDREDGVTLRFEATESSSRASRSVFVQVPDRGRIEAELSDVPGMDASSLVEISEPAIMRDLRVVQVVFSPTPEGAGTGDFARALTVTLRATANRGSTRESTRDVLSRAPSTISTRATSSTTMPRLRSDSWTRRRAADATPSRTAPATLSYPISATPMRSQPLVDWKNEKGVQSKLVTLVETGSTEARDQEATSRPPTTRGRSRPSTSSSSATRRSGARVRQPDLHGQLLHHCRRH